MNLIILTDNDRTGEDTYTLHDYRFDHIRTILKLDEGDTLEVGLLNGPQGTARIESLSEQQVVLTAVGMSMFPEPSPSIDIICALPRPQTLKKVLATAAAMGVRRLYLVRANRVEKSYFQSPLLEEDNFTPFLIEGLSQGKLTRLPEVTIHNRFRKFFEDTLSHIEDRDAGTAKKILADVDSDSGLGSLYDGTAARLLLAIGPEGGWVPFEVDLMKSVGFECFSLGRWVLRVETAVTAALAQIELLRKPNGV